LEQVRVTSYVRRGNATLLAVASWATNNLTVSMDVDLSALGIGTNGATAVAPAMDGVQPHATFPIVGGKLVDLPVEAAGGWLLVVSTTADGVSDAAVH
jgi:hypothetical protein